MFNLAAAEVLTKNITNGEIVRFNWSGVFAKNP